MRYLAFLFAGLLLGGPLAAIAAPAPAATVPATAAPAGPRPATQATPGAPAVAGAETASPADTESEAETEADPVGPWVYMVARVKLTGTDFTQVVFFRHRSVTTLEACEAERSAGMISNGWKFYSTRYLKTLKGISFRIDYRCVESDLHLRYWRQGDPLDRFYLVRTEAGKLTLEQHRDFFACRRALNRDAATETIDAFCGIASQAILETATPPATPAAPAAAP